MLPRAGGTLAGTSTTPQQQELHSANATPKSLASWRKLQLVRKQAIANGTKSKDESSIPGAPLIAQLKAQQMEITYLKRERESMSEKLKVLEGLPGQLKELMSKLDQAKPHSQAVQAFEARVAELEKMRPLLEKVEALETAVTKHAARPAQSAKLERDVDELMRWKSQQATRPEIEGIVKANVQSIAQSEMKAVEDRFNKRIDEEHKTLATLSAGFRVLDDSNKDLDRKIDVQLQKLAGRIAEVDRNEGETHKLVKGLRNDLGTYIGPIQREFEHDKGTLVERLNKLGLVVGQVKNFQSEQSKLSNEQRKLTLDQGGLSGEQKKLESRVDALEKKANLPGPGFKKVGTTVAGPSANSNSVSGDLPVQRLNRIDKDIEQLQQSCAGVEALSSQVARLGERAETTKEQIETLNVVKAQYDQLSDRMSTVEGQSSGLADLENLRGSLAELQSRLSDLETRNSGAPLQTSDASDEVARLSTEVSRLDKEMDGLFDRLGEAEVTYHNHRPRLDVLETAVPALFRENFDPFKKDMEKGLERIDQSVDALDGRVGRLEQPPLQTPPQPPSPPDSTVPDTKVLKVELTELQTTVADESSARQQAIHEMQQIIAFKADKAIMEQQMDRFALSFRNLQDQYNNITTDDLHARMVHWFLQNYPSNAANMVQQFASLQQEVKTLQDQLQSRLQDLTTPLAAAPNPPGSAKPDSEVILPQTLARIDEACNSAKEAIKIAEEAKTKADEAAEPIGGIQRTLHNLNMPTAPFARTIVTQALEKSIRDLQKEVEAGLADARDARVSAISDERAERINATNELRSAAGNNHDLRVKEMKELKASVASCTTTQEELSTRLTSLEETSQALRHDVDTINNDFIAPNQELFGYWPSVLIVVCQLQSLLESINQNLPKAPIAIEWHVDLNELGVGDVGSSRDKGKSR